MLVIFVPVSIAICRRRPSWKAALRFCPVRRGRHAERSGAGRSVTGLFGCEMFATRRHARPGASRACVFPPAVTVINCYRVPGRAGIVAGVVLVITWRGTVILMFAGLLFGAVSASAQHQHPPQDEQIHEKFYSTWMRPDNPHLSCCSQHDCYPTEARKEDGIWFAKRREDGKWLRIPPEKVEQNRDNPDGRSHLCAPRPERAYSADVFCFTAGSGI